MEGFTRGYPLLLDLSAEETSLLFNLCPCRKGQNNESIFFLKKSVLSECYRGQLPGFPPVHSVVSPTLQALLPKAEQSVSLE